MAKQTFSLEQARLDGNLCRALIWIRDPETKEEKFRYCTCTILQPANSFGQYQVMRVKDGWFATTDTVRNLTCDHKIALGLGA